jgi:hypothetical protein
MENQRMAEGVGFEPTVSFPTLDFESSALNRTQPPFLEAEENAEPAYAKSFGVASVERRTSNPPSQVCYGAAGIECNLSSIGR